MVLGDATVGPLLFFNGTAMLFPACFAAAGCLANVDLVTFFTDVLIDSFLFLWVNLSLIFITKNILKLCARFEAGIDARFG